MIAYRTDQILSLLCAIFLIVILFLPKIPVIVVAHQDIRLEDFLSLAIVLKYYMVNNIKLKLAGTSKKVFFLFSYIFVILCFYLVIYGFELLNILFGLRWLQYFLVGAVMFRWSQENPKLCINIMLLFLVLVFIGALLYILNGEKYRYRAWFDGPWELGMITIYCLISISAKSSRLFSGMSFLGTLIILYAGLARIQLLAFVIFSIMYSSKLRKVLFIATMVGFPVAIVAYTVGGIGLAPLDISKLSPSAIFKTAELVYEYQRSAFQELARQNDGLDHSLLERLFIWKGFISIWFERLPVSLMFGIGLGTGGVVIDGFYVRLLLEAGVFGSYLLIAVFFSLREAFDKQHFNFVLVALMIFSITNDPLTAFRPAVILFVCLGYLSYISKKTNQETFGLLNTKC